MCIGLFCATRTSETFGVQWKSCPGDRLVILNTAYEGELYRGRVKTGASRSAVPIPDDIIPVVEAWRRESPDPSPDALMFPTFGRGERKGRAVPRRAKNFLKWRIYPIADRLKILGHISGDAANPRNRSSEAWDHEGRSGSFAARQHQDHG